MRAVFVHAARPSLEPLANYYPLHWPELHITHLLDDGIMGLFAAGEFVRADERLLAMVRTGHSEYGAQAALISCSALTLTRAADLRAASPIPVLKIDEPMARLATASAKRIGLLVTFPPTLEISRNLLAEAGAQEVITELVPEAIAALLRGDKPQHDELLFAAAERLKARQIDALVLAQVSMGPLVPELHRRLGLPVYSSLETSLAALRELV